MHSRLSLSIVLQQFSKICVFAIKHEIRMETCFSIGDGEGSLFRIYPWFRRSLLRYEFLDLFMICLDPMVLVASVAKMGLGTYCSDHCADRTRT